MIVAGISSNEESEATYCLDCIAQGMIESHALLARERARRPRSGGPRRCSERYTTTALRRYHLHRYNGPLLFRLKSLVQQIVGTRFMVLQSTLLRDC